MDRPTVDEVFCATYSYLCGEIDEEELTAKIGEPNMPHGEVVERRLGFKVKIDGKNGEYKKVTIERS